jgi:hypothetical protein
MSSISSSFSCPFSRLATVEHQLILHFLPSRDRVHLARINKLFHATITNHPFAWLHVDPLRVDARQLIAHAGPLAHMAPLLVHVEAEGAAFDYHDQAEDDVPIDLDALLTVRGVLGLRCDWLTPSRWRDLFLHPRAGESLRALETSQILSAKTLLELGRLKLLQRLMLVLRLNVDVTWLRPLSEELHHLTDLDVSLEYVHVPTGLLQTLPLCRHLRRLALRQVHFDPCADFARLFSSSPSTLGATLEFLLLDTHLLSPIGGEAAKGDEYADAFAAMKQLRTLHLRQVFGVDTLLRHAIAACGTTLRRLVVEFQTIMQPRSIDLYGSSHPSASVLAAALSRLPPPPPPSQGPHAKQSLRVELHMPATLARWRQAALDAHEHVASLAEVVDPQFHALQECAKVEQVYIVDNESLS